MRAVVQRVKSARVSIDQTETSAIKQGLLVFLAVRPEDTEKDIDYMISKILNLRILEDENGKMNLSLLDRNLELMIVSQFTLYGDVRKGRRPSFVKAGSPEEAEKVYDRFIEEIRKYPVDIKTGKFQAKMDVELVNDGPVTILLDSERKF